MGVLCIIELQRVLTTVSAANYPRNGTSYAGEERTCFPPLSEGTEARVVLSEDTSPGTVTSSRRSFSRCSPYCVLKLCEEGVEGWKTEGGLVVILRPVCFLGGFFGVVLFFQYTQESIAGWFPFAITFTIKPHKSRSVLFLSPCAKNGKQIRRFSSSAARDGRVGGGRG